MNEQLHVRLPADLKAWLAKEAARNGSSQNSEIIRALRERMERLCDAAVQPASQAGQ
jgi:hypothetical protein